MQVWWNLWHSFTAFHWFGQRTQLNEHGYHAIFGGKFCKAKNYLCNSDLRRLLLISFSLWPKYWQSWFINWIVINNKLYSFLFMIFNRIMIICYIFTVQGSKKRKGPWLQILLFNISLKICDQSCFWSARFSSSNLLVPLCSPNLISSLRSLNLSFSTIISL